MKKIRKISLILFLSLFIFLTGCVAPGEIDKVPDHNSNSNKEQIEEIVLKNFEEFDKKEYNFTKNKPSEEEVSEITFLSINDFHGALEEFNSEYGASRVGNYLINEYNKNPNGTILISAGDMFQGTGLSNYRHGRDVVTLMNGIGFDLMVYGNHEFDWGIEEMFKFQDGDESNGEAHFPFICCNIMSKKTNEPLTNIDPYVVIDKGNVKVGIIGYMGYKLEGTISASKIKDYYFADPVPMVHNLSKELRTKENCDIVIAVGHDFDEKANKNLASAMLKNGGIDAIFNAHTHQFKSGNIVSEDSRNVPYLQAGCNGQGVSKMTFKNVEGKWTNTLSRYYKMDHETKNIEIETYINDLIKVTEPLFKRELCTAGSTINKYAAADWGVNELNKAIKADVAFINVSGFRSVGFPIHEGHKVTVEDVYRMMPFDNVVKLSTITGYDITKLANDDYFAYSSDLVKKSDGYYLNGQKIDGGKYYRVAAIDYIFDNQRNPFIHGRDIEQTDLLFRDILIDALDKIGVNNKWYC